MTSSLTFTTTKIRTTSDTPKDATTINHKLLVQAGYVDQLMAGVFSYLPLGLKVLRNIETIVRDEMNAIGGLEVHLPALHPAQILQQSGSWDDVDVLFKIKSQTGKDYALGYSHEEVITPLAKQYIKSYKDLPLALYQIQWKFRDELRAKSGILRGREFEMKDMYSFHKTQEDFDRFYEIVKQAYLKIFSRFGLVAKVTEASGGSFTQKISYEFMVLTSAGEDDILYCPQCEFCVNTEIAKVKAGAICPKCSQSDSQLQTARAAEVGNVFDLGQKFAKDFDLEFADETGKLHYPIMGCYGIGITRSMGVIVEKFHDEKGIIWPAEISPFQAHLISLPGAESQAKIAYQEMTNAGIEILWDDRNETAGKKFSAADLLGIPVRLVISQKTGSQIEWKQRTSAEVQLLSLDQVITQLLP